MAFSISERFWNAALWRTRGEHRPLIGEFSLQIKFKDRTQ
jgi:hypothetical protein